MKCLITFLLFFMSINVFAEKIDDCLQDADVLKRTSCYVDSMNNIKINEKKIPGCSVFVFNKYCLGLEYENDANTFDFFDYKIRRVKKIGDRIFGSQDNIETYPIENKSVFRVTHIEDGNVDMFNAIAEKAKQLYGSPINLSTLGMLSLKDLSTFNLSYIKSDQRLHYVWDAGDFGFTLLLTKGKKGNILYKATYVLK